MPCEILNTNMSIKSTIAAAFAAPFLLSSAAFAGPYVNVETNSNWDGDNYTGNTTDLHIGFEGSTEGGVGYYVQGGPSVIALDGVDSETQFSGKAGGSATLTETVGVYGELAFTSDDDDLIADSAAKLGLTYKF